MPPEDQWAAFFDPESILDKLSLSAGIGDVVEFGCGYGTFTIPAARRSAGTVHTFDVDPEMVVATAHRARIAGFANVVVTVRDFVEERTGLAASNVAYAMVFNILHAEQPERLLAEAWRVLMPGGTLGISRVVITAGGKRHVITCGAD